MANDDVVILSAARTPIGSFLGSLASVPAPQLGAAAIRGALEKANVEPKQVEQVVMGNVLQAGIGQAPARQAGIAADIPHSAGAVTIHKVCGSGLKAVMYAANDIRCGDYQVAVAGGMENMSATPYLLPKARTGYRMGNGQILDHMVSDGLWDPYGDKHMGNCAETCARHYEFSRETQDEFAKESYRRALASLENGAFAAEIVAVEVPGRRGAVTVVDRDEEPERGNFDKMAKLRPAFDREGTVTAANASKINDGAAALVVSSAAQAQAMGRKPVARIVAHASIAQEPEWFTTAPVGAVRAVLDRAGMTLDQIDVFEINEAFAVVALAAIHELELPPEKVNMLGGAVAMGHPIGASGARILTTALNALERTGGTYGCVAICIGGGEAAAMIVERLA
ncbi:MAG: thiolase family protein [bacterium]|nr:thiolase family protein [bacterium]